jgi:DNA-binding winged helix-turn-helix (wHTH) protein
MASRDALSYRFGPFELRPTDHLLLQDGEPVRLQRKVFDVLSALVERNGQLVTHEELIAAAWTRKEPSPGRLSHVVWQLRTLLGDGIPIETVSGCGYRFTARVSDGSTARRHYLEGRHFWAQRTPASLAQAIERFQAAIDVEPGFAKAYSGLADCYALLGHWGVASPRESMPKAKAAASRALELDPRLAEAHASFGLASKNFDWDLTQARISLGTSLALDPTYASARLWYADVLTILERIDDGLAELERARDLDPLSPIVEARIALQHFFARNYERAVECVETARRMGTQSLAGLAIMGAAYERLGRYEDAVLALAQGASRQNPLGLSLLGHAHAAHGDRQEAFKALRELEGAALEGYVSPYHEARIYSGLEDGISTRSALTRAVDERSDFVVWLHIDPLFDAWHDEAWFAELLVRVGLAPGAR